MRKFYELHLRHLKNESINFILINTYVAIRNAKSFASDPELTKNTVESSEGKRDVNRSA